MFCSECGKQVKDDAKFCGECGATQSATDLVQKSALNPIKTSLLNGDQRDTLSYKLGLLCKRNPQIFKIAVAGIFLLVLFTLLGGKKEAGTETAQSNKVASVADLEPQVATHAFGVCMAYHSAVKKDGIDGLNTAPIIASGKIRGNATDEGQDWIYRYFMLGENEEAKKIMLNEAEKSCQMLNLPF